MASAPNSDDAPTEDKAASVLRYGIVGCGSVCEVKSGPAFFGPKSSLVAVMRRDMAKFMVRLQT